MANTYKNTQTLNPALRSIGNMNVRGVVKGGTSDTDKAERYGLPVMVSETGYIDPSLLEGGGGGGGVTEQRVKELINDNLQPYNDGAEIKADVETKITSANAEVMIADKFQPYADGQAIKDEVNTKQSAAQVENAIADKLQPYNDGQEIKDDIDAKVSKLELPEAIKEQIQQSTEVKTEITNIVSDTLAPYTDGQEIKDEVDEKVNTTDYDADFVVFDGEQGSTKGEKIKSYIDNISPPAPENVIEKTDMSPYGQTDKTQTGTEIETAIAEKVDYVEFETFESEVGDNIGEKIRSAISGGTTGITESKLSECLSPYSTSSADITEIGTKIKADTDAKVASDDFDAEFATFDTETGATQGERIKAYIDNHAPSPENAISQQDMSPYGADDKANTGSDIENAISEKVSTDEFDTQFAVFDGETGATKGDKIKAYIDEHGGGGDPTAILQANMSPYGQTDKTQTGSEIAAAIASAGKTDEQIKQLASEQITTEISQGGAIDDAVAEKLDEKFQPYNSGQEIKDAIDAKPDADDVVAVSDMSPFGQTTKQYIGEEIVAKIEDIIAENLDESGDITIEIKDRANSITKTTLSESMSPYSQSVGDIAGIGSRIKADTDTKLATTAFDSEFSNFDGEQGVKKGEKIQNYIDGVASEKVDVTAMSPYDDDPTTIGIAISDAIEEVARTDQEIKNLAEAQIVTDVGVGGTIDTAIDAKLTNTLTSTDLSPYGQTDKSQTGTEIAEALALKADAVDVSGKVDTTTYDADFSNFGVSGHSKGENIANYVNAQGALKVDITAMAPFADEPTKIGEAIQEAIDAGGGGGISTETFQQYMTPYGQTSATSTGAEIKSGLDAKLSTATFDTEFEAFGQGSDTKGELIKNYVDSQMNGKLNISAMDPFIGDESDVGQNIADAIDEKLDADTLKTYMEPYGQQDITQLGNDIKDAISAVSKTDEEIKELAEAQIVTDVGDGGTIDTAIDNKFTAENVLRQSDLSPFGDDDITETGADIQIAINAVDAKTKTDQQIKDLADTQITTQLALNGSIDTAIKSNAVVPTDLGDFYDDDKTQIGANIKAAIESGGDPSNPSVKKSHMTPYGQSDIADTGEDIKNAIDSSIETALNARFAPYTNGRSIQKEQATQDANFNENLQNLAQNVPNMIKQAFNSSELKIQDYVDTVNEFPGIDLTTSQSYEATFGQYRQIVLDDSRVYNNANGYYKHGNKLYFWSFYYYNQYAYEAAPNEKLYCYDLETKTVKVAIDTGLSLIQSGMLFKSSAYINGCINDPNCIVAFTHAGGTSYYTPADANAFLYISRDNGETWTRISADGQPGFSGWGNVMASGFNELLRDTDGNYITKGGGGSGKYIFRVNFETAKLETLNCTDWKGGNFQFYNRILKNHGEFYFVLADSYRPYYIKANWNYLNSMPSSDLDKTEFATRLLNAPYLPSDNTSNNTTLRASQTFSAELKPGRIYALMTYAGYPDYSYNNDVFLAYHDINDGDITDPNNPLKFHVIKHWHYDQETAPYGNYVYFLLIGIFPTSNSALFWHCYYENTTPKYSLVRLDLVTNQLETIFDNLTGFSSYFWNNTPAYPLIRYYEYLPKFYDYPVYIMKNAYAYTDNTKQYGKLYVEPQELDSLKVGDLLITCRTPNDNFLLCDGSTFEEEDYPLLAKIITDLTLPTGNTSSVITGGTTTFKAYIKAK